MSTAAPTVQFGLFTRGEPLGEGSFAITYITESSTGERAALKHLKPNAQPGGPERFQNETWALRQLNHPNIPKFIEEGEYDDRPYFIMSLAKGKSLRKRLAQPVGERGTFGERWVLRVLAAVLSAVCAVHEKGIMHRDIKDDNVIVDDDAESVTLIDFGFCKGMNQPRDADSFFQVGAPRYSPPSKLRYPSLTHRTHDVFSIGVLAYLLLTNQYPWSVESDQDHGLLAELMENAVPPDVTELNSVVSYETSSFVRLLLTIEDNRRPTPQDALSRVNDLLLANPLDFRYPAFYRDSFPKVSRDPVHGDIRLSELELRLINSPTMQRLRRIKQLGFTDLVYCGATHTRLAHSIGVLFVADQITNSIEQTSGAKVDPEERLLIRLYALCHDITHLPFGHTIEDELGFFPRHDENLCRVQRLLEDDPQFVNLLKVNSHGLTLLRYLQSGEITSELSLAHDVVDGHTGADVLDYIDRDAYFCGVDHAVDSAIYRQFTMLNVGTAATSTERHLVSRLYGSLGVRDDAGFAIESLLLQRFALFMKIYTHPTKIAAGAMLGKALHYCIAAHGANEVERVIERFGDEDLISWLSLTTQPSETSTIALRLRNRDLFRPVYIADPVPADDRNNNGYENAQKLRSELQLDTVQRRADLESTISQSAGVREDQVAIYWQKTAPGIQMVSHFVQERPGQSPSRSSGTIRSRMIERHLSIWKIYVFVDSALSDEKCRNIAAAAQVQLGFENNLRVP